MLLGLPIGMFLHLVFDGAWNNTEVFWWPFFGWSFDESPLPVIDRGVVEPRAGGDRRRLCVWLWRHNGLGDRSARARFLHDGQLDAVPERFG